MTDYLTGLGLLAVVVLGVTEVLGRALTKLPLRKDQWALLAGPAAGAAAYAAGFLPVPAGTSGWGGWALAVLGGLGSTAIAGLANDYVVKAIQKPKANGGGA